MSFYGTNGLIGWWQGTDGSTLGGSGEVIPEPPTGALRNIMGSGAITSAVLAMPGTAPDGATITTKHRIHSAVTAPVLRWVVSKPEAGNQVANTGTMRAAYRTGSDTTWRNLTFGGSATATFPVPSGASVAIIDSDPINVAIPAGEDLELHVWAKPDSTGFMPGSATGRVFGYDPGYVLGGPETITGTTYANGQTSGSLRPAAIFSTTAAPSWLLTGDSITWASNSYQEQALKELGKAHTKAAMGGEAFSHFPSRWAQRYSGIIDYVSHVFCAYGVNDVSQGVELTKTRAFALWNQYKTAGVGTVIQTTATPCFVGSTDGYTTLENQTVPSNSRVAWNQWLRDGAPLISGAPAATGTTDPTAIRAGHASHPVKHVLDLAAAVESSQDSGKWRVDLGAIGGDGTHPNTLGHTTLKTAVVSALTGWGY